MQPVFTKYITNVPYKQSRAPSQGSPQRLLFIAILEKDGTSVEHSGGLGPANASLRYPPAITPKAAFLRLPLLIAPALQILCSSKAPNICQKNPVSCLTTAVKSKRWCYAEKSLQINKNSRRKGGVVMPRDSLGTLGSMPLEHSLSTRSSPCGGKAK